MDNRAKSTIQHRPIQQGVCFEARQRAIHLARRRRGGGRTEDRRVGRVENKMSAEKKNDLIL